LLNKNAIEKGEKKLNVFNPVAVAISPEKIKKDQLLALGGALYNLRVTGPRVFDPTKSDFGTCCKEYSTPYIVMNAAIGVRSTDIISAVEKFKKAHDQVTQK